MAPPSAQKNSWETAAIVRSLGGKSSVAMTKPVMLIPWWTHNSVKRLIKPNNSQELAARTQLTSMFPGVYQNIQYHYLVVKVWHSSAGFRGPTSKGWERRQIGERKGKIRRGKKTGQDGIDRGRECGLRHVSFDYQLLLPQSAVMRYKWSVTFLHAVRMNENICNRWRNFYSFKDV